MRLMLHRSTKAMAGNTTTTVRRFLRHIPSNVLERNPANLYSVELHHRRMHDCTNVTAMLVDLRMPHTRREGVSKCTSLWSPPQVRQYSIIQPITFPPPHTSTPSNFPRRPHTLINNFYIQNDKWNKMTVQYCHFYYYLK